MLEEEPRIEKYRKTGHYYIPTETYDLLWTDDRMEWRMTVNAWNCRSCIELDKQDREMDVFGYEIVTNEFRLDPDKYEIDQVKYMGPSELDKL